jgi:hypothetical protein
MNKHLNIFSSYTKEDRDKQLENDLTRALAICLQEDVLFLEKITKYILSHKEGVYKKLFAVEREESQFDIQIQRRISEIEGFEILFAVSVSGKEMNIDTFFQSQHNKEYDPITDLFISIQDVAILFEVKPNDTDCSNQIYNQAYNAIEEKDKIEEIVIPVDLCWRKIMEILEEVINFKKNFGSRSRILEDFKHFIRLHNYRWLPITPLSSLKIASDQQLIERRIRTAIQQARIFQILNDRMGLELTVPWASELLFSLTNQSFELKLFPGNTKKQGWHVFKNNLEPQFAADCTIDGIKYNVEKNFHFKFTSFQKYFAGFNITYLSGYLNKVVLTKDVFSKQTGRKTRGKEWDNLEEFLDKNIDSKFKWKVELGWDNIIASGKNQFDFTLGYYLSIKIPYSVLSDIDKEINNLEPLTMFLEECAKSVSKLLK